MCDCEKLIEENNMLRQAIENHLQAWSSPYSRAKSHIRDDANEDLWEVIQ